MTKTANNLVKPEREYRDSRTSQNFGGGLNGRKLICRKINC